MGGKEKKAFHGISGEALYGQFSLSHLDILKEGKWDAAPFGTMRDNAQLGVFWRFRFSPPICYLYRGRKGHAIGTSSFKDSENQRFMSSIEATH